MYHGPRGVPWPSRGVPWPLYEEYVLEDPYYLYLRPCFPQPDSSVLLLYLPSVPVCAICSVFLGVSLPGSKETATHSPRGASEANDASHEDRYVRAIRMMNYMHIVPVGPPRCAARVSQFCYTPPLLLLYAQQLKPTFHYAIQLANQTSS